jgi:putative redox protein
MMTSNRLKGLVSLMDEKVKFQCKVNGREPVMVDYTPPLGNGEGYTSLELLLLSLASCFASTVKLMVNNHLKKKIDDLKVSISGIRRTEHPTSFESINLEMIYMSDETEPETLEEVMQLAKDKFCPVWAMLNDNTEITTSITKL